MTVVSFQQQVAELRRTGMSARDAITRAVNERTEDQ